MQITASICKFIKEVKQFNDNFRKYICQAWLEENFVFVILDSLFLVHL